jgi:broad specificity phosphatase PhoE
MQVFFVRHGRTDANTQGVYAGGGLDVPVSEEGFAEAARIAESEEFQDMFRSAFDGKPVPLVYTSPMTRARQTAAVLFPKAAQTVVEDLREFKFGAFEGRIYADLKNDPDFLRWTHGNDDSPCPPDGDSINTCTARVKAAFSEIARKRFAAKDPSPIVLVAHGGVAMAFLHAFIDKEKPFFSWETPNCGVWRFDCGLEKNGEITLRLIAPPSLEGYTPVNYNQ